MVGSQTDFPEEDDDMVHIDDEGKVKARGARPFCSSYCTDKRPCLTIL